ncbi:MAG: hypothetical protein ABI579_04000, partial [Candidatus Sumerlaeota bacterium]
CYGIDLMQSTHSDARNLLLRFVEDGSRAEILLSAPIAKRDQGAALPEPDGAITALWFRIK